jgi:hypothetical protein
LITFWYVGNDDFVAISVGPTGNKKSIHLPVGNMLPKGKHYDNMLPIGPTDMEK